MSEYNKGLCNLGIYSIAFSYFLNWLTLIGGFPRLSVLIKELVKQNMSQSNFISLINTDEKEHKIGKRQRKTLNDWIFCTILFLICKSRIYFKNHNKDTIYQTSFLHSEV